IYHKAEKMLKTWYIFLLCWLSLRLEANPGLEVRITQKGLDYDMSNIARSRKIGMELLKTFPHWSVQESFSVVKISYVISRLRNNVVDFPETSSFVPGAGIYLSVAQACATISADWRIHTWLLWIYSFLSGYLEKPIHTTLDKNVSMPKLMDALLRKHKRQVDTFAQVDYSLVSSPAVFQSHINLDLKGTVYPVGNHTDPPLVPTPFAPPNNSDFIRYLRVSNYFLESASLAYYRAGAFNFTMSEEIAQSFAAAGPVLLRLMATSPPAVSLNAGRCVLQITGCVEVFAVLPNSTTQYIFAGNLVNSQYESQFDYKQTEVDYLISSEEQNSLVENFLSYALQRIVIPVISDKLGKGFPLLNLVHTSLTGPVIKINQQRSSLQPSEDSLVSGQLSANPGLKVRITQKGLEYAKEVGLEILKQNMEKEHFPDLTGHEKFWLGSGIKLVIGNASLTVDMNWSIRTWMFKDSGRGTVHISKVFVTAIFSTTLDNTGPTSISFTSCRTTSGDVDIKLNGKTGFLHNFFIKYLKKPIHRSLVTNSCPNIRAGIQLIDKDLRSLNAVMQIDDLAEVDYSLSSSPAVFRPFIDLDLKGVVFPAGNYTDSLYVAASFTIPDQSDSMLYLAFSEYFFQTSSFAYYTAGAFNMTIAEETCSYFNINTEIFGSIIPEVAKYSVTPYPVMLKLMSTEIPIISLQRDSFTVQIQGSMEALAILPDSTIQSLFTLNIVANTSISLNIFDQKLTGSLCLNRIQFSLAHSNVGSFEVLLLENILSYILQTEVIPSANAKLSKGFPLPSLANVTLTRPHITIEQFFAETPKSMFAVKHKTQLRKGNAKVVFNCSLPSTYLVPYKI
ncbi:hypothetical protein Nmel_005477, partial [Mimus melanotis]